METRVDEELRGAWESFEARARLLVMELGWLALRGNGKRKVASTANLLGGGSVLLKWKL